MKSRYANSVGRRGKVIRETVIQDNGNDLIYLYTHFGGNKDIMNYLKIYGIGNNFMRAG